MDDKYINAVKKFAILKERIFKIEHANKVPMTIIECCNQQSKTIFDLRELNKHLIK